jgi:hypothetical protein
VHHEFFRASASSGAGKSTFCRIKGDAQSETTGAAFHLSHPRASSLACDFFDLFVFFIDDPMFFIPHHRIVILSEAPRRSIA